MQFLVSSLRDMFGTAQYLSPSKPAPGLTYCDGGSSEGHKQRPANKLRDLPFQPPSSRTLTRKPASPSRHRDRRGQAVHPAGHTRGPVLAGQQTRQGLEEWVHAGRTADSTACDVRGQLECEHPDRAGSNRGDHDKGVGRCGETPIDGQIVKGIFGMPPATRHLGLESVTQRSASSRRGARFGLGQ